MLVALAAARANRFVWNSDPAYRPVAPAKPGLHVLRDIDLGTLADYIDWGPFFQTWDPRRSVSENPRRRARRRSGARGFSPDAKAMLATLIDEKWLTANAVFGLYPANAVGDDIEFYADQTRERKLMSWHNLRQQHERPAGKPHYCLADFVAPRGRLRRRARLGWRLRGGAPESASKGSSPSSLRRTTTTARSC